MGFVYNKSYMAEGVSNDLPPKKPGKLGEIARTIKEALPWDPIGKKKRTMKKMEMSAEIAAKFTSVARGEKPQVRIVLPEGVPTSSMQERNWSTLPDIGRNIEASKQFLTSLRDQTKYTRDPNDPRFLRSGLGYRVETSVENGWFAVADLLATAKDRYQLPLAIFIEGNHARLVVKGAYQTPEGKKVVVWDPMDKGFKERSVNEPFAQVFANGLIGSKLAQGEYDIARFFEGPEFEKHKRLLMDAKTFNFQRDVKNCIPYCLFANAMIYGLEPGQTPFKEFGRKQFEEDFGVRILTREDFLPKPRVQE